MSLMTNKKQMASKQREIYIVCFLSLLIWYRNQNQKKYLNRLVLHAFALV
jgi:hypothetical protein